MLNSKDILSVDVKYDCEKDTFCNDIQAKRKPCILRGLNIGPCVDKWSADYLSAEGGDVPVKIHVSRSPRMNFLTKNYSYKTLPFRELVTRASRNIHEDYYISEDEYYYLRSLGDDVRKDIADIRKQFPSLADDIIFPDFIPKESFFSSVFRIASEKLQLWTHYDIMDNLLIQVKGKKRVVLFAPSDMENLYMIGDKSQITDIDDPDLEKYPKFAQAQKYEAFLMQGDVLFIPALWFHNVIALEFGVAVNVFWKNLTPHNLYDKKDPYGNKDLVPASRAIDSLNRALKMIDDLPDEYKDFYGRKMVEIIKSKTYL